MSLVFPSRPRRFEILYFLPIVTLLAAATVIESAEEGSGQHMLGRVMLGLHVLVFYGISILMVFRKNISKLVIILIILPPTAIITYIVLLFLAPRLKTASKQDIPPVQAGVLPSRQRPLPTWCSAIFVIDIILCILDASMFLKMLTGDWQRSIRATGVAPAFAIVNAAITAGIIVCAVIADILLLSRKRRGVGIGVAAIVLVAAAITVQLVGASSDEMGMTITAVLSIVRVAYSSVYVGALVKAKRVLVG